MGIGLGVETSMDVENRHGSRNIYLPFLNLQAKLASLSADRQANPNPFSNSFLFLTI